MPRWVAWQTESRAPGKPPTKVPYAPDGRRARADAPASWGNCQAARERAAVLPKPFGTGGIGIELGDHAGHALAGIDLDTCRDDAGNLAPWAAAVLARFVTYAEVSPSGSGLKLFFTYDPADAVAIRTAMGTETGRKWARKGGDHPPGIEFYLSGRFFAVTGQRHAGAPEELRQVALADLLWLIQVAGPAMALDGAEGAAQPKQRTGGGQKQAGGDGSRSAQAFKVACRVKRQGGDFPAFLSDLDADADTKAWKAEKGQADGGRELRRCWERAVQSVDQDVLLTEHGVAVAFTARFRDRLRFCHDAGAWFEWTGTHWRQDRKHAAYSFARALVAEANKEAEFKTQAITGKAAFAGGVEKMAQRDPAHAVTAEEWDRDPYLLATPGGTVDLRTGKMRPARQVDMMTKLAAVAPSTAASPDQWLRFLDDATGRDDALIRFLQQWCGYCLTGDTREHALLFGYGPGGNGKSVFLNTVAGIMGDYATTATMDAFTASHGDKHSTDLAMLRGARLVTASETEEGRAWAESRIKQMTGGDPITARFMRQDNFTFRPAFKLTIVGNHKPVLKNVDDAARRRFNILPFVRKPVNPDRELEAKLRAEWPAILNWMIEGCVAWQRDGLQRPAVVRTATAEYFTDQDTLAQWIEDCCKKDPARGATHTDLWWSWSNYAKNRGENPGGSKGFSQALQKRGYSQIKDANGIRGRGIGGLVVHTSEQPEGPL